MTNGKHIRPWGAFKKANPDFYQILLGLSTGRGMHGHLGGAKGSKKDEENRMYWYYTWLSIGNQVLELEGIPEIDENTPLPTPCFFYKTPDSRNNVETITELGRLLLAGWYYGVKDLSERVAMYIVRAYLKREAEGELPKDSDFTSAIIHLRTNLLYYSGREDELKLFILKRFFKDKLQSKLPPPPDEVKEYLSVIERVQRIRSTQRKKGIDSWIVEAENLEYYVEYLQGLLDVSGVQGYLSYKDYLTQEDRETLVYMDTVQELYRDYERGILRDANKLLLEIE